MRSLALAVAVVSGCAGHASCPVYQPSAASSPFMWQVEGTAGSLFVVATHQGAAREDAPARAWTELDRADVFVAEADEVREGDAYHHPAGWDAAYYLPKGTHLDDLISQGDVEELARDLDTNYASVSRMKPWVAFVLLASSALRLAQPSLNEAYLGRAINAV